MKTQLARMFIFIFLTLIVSCSSFKRSDEAIRIKSSANHKYHELFDRDSNFVAIRNSNTLRGTVLKIVEVTKPVDCTPENKLFETQKYVVFLDSLQPDKKSLEMIPIEDIDLVGPKLHDLPPNEHGNINWFENFNNPLDPSTIREVPVEKINIPCKDTNTKFCDCSPLILPTLQCPDCDYKSYFVELRGGIAAYRDRKLTDIDMIQQVYEGRSAYFGDIAAGYRAENWGLGVVFSSGVPIYNSFVGDDFYRPFALLHGRWHFAEFFCMRPFLFGEFGLAVDDITLDLFRVAICEDCNDKIRIEDKSKFDVSIPISWGLGAGLDIPLPYCWFDLSFDIGYRSLAIGEYVETSGFSNVPSKRRVNMFFFRLGITLGY
jgi:hypothetical protein